MYIMQIWCVEIGFYFFMLCTYYRESGQCAHVLAVIMNLEQWKISGFVEIPSMLSSTSLPQQWDKPRGDKIQPEPVSQMIISNPSNLNRKRKPIVASFVDTRKTEISEMDMEILKKFKQAPISYLVSTAAGSTVDTPFGAHYIGSPLSYHAPLILPITKPRAAENCGSTVPKSPSYLR
ncbi:uncharacterized protein LOC125681149 [Ostrea edulis]|uniref:uncharacterized protein LOC125681149 n=1 Tax=Ostrea edulis TaxID=37623 RepID=UPI0024AEAB8F|nr:uncharacterized protein LOC125681149 [Ostrea edulis]